MSRPESPAQPAQLTVGGAIDAFNLPGLDGRVVSPDDFRGDRVLLVHWSPGCGFCELIAPELCAVGGGSGSKSDTAGARQPRECRRESPAGSGVRTQMPDTTDGRRVPACSGCVPTSGDACGIPPRWGWPGYPAACCRRRRDPGHGAEAVGKRSKRKRLPGERPLSTSRLVRDGLKAGTPAPLFRLPDLHGETVSLEGYRGRRVMLVFTDPHCGPCEELSPRLAQLQGQYQDEGLGLIMVARGDLDENRRKADKYGFQFPVVLQEAGIYLKSTVSLPCQ